MWKFCRLYYMFMLKFSKYHSSKKTLVEIKIFPRKFHKFWHLWPRIVMPFMKIKLCCHNFPHQRFWKTIFSNSLSFFYIYIFEIPLAICKIKPSLVVLIFLRASKCYFCILIITRWIKCERKIFAIEPMIFHHLKKSIYSLESLFFMDHVRFEYDGYQNSKMPWRNYNILRPHSIKQNMGHNCMHYIMFIQA